MVNKNDSKCQYVLDNYINVDDQGNVTYKKNGKKVPCYKSPSGYLRANFIYKKEDYALVVHRLVMVKFKGSQPLEVDHINKDKLDNRLSNLRYVTRSENCKGRKTKYKRSLTDDDCKELRSLYNNGWSKGALSRKYGISMITVNKRLKDDYLDKAANYRFINPQGELIIGNNIAELSRKLGLNASGFSALRRGAMLSYKGWKLESSRDKIYKPSKHYIDDVTLSAYCKANNLHYRTTLDKIHKGKAPKGYNLRESK